MTTAPPLILELKENALDDGPGVRTVIFLKGCVLSCAWCHNPESVRREAEMAWDASACLGCSRCLRRCPKRALRTGRARVDRGRCDACFDCLPACPAGALSRVGEPMDIEALVARALRDKPFFDASGGGVTISGGEPTLHMGWLAALVAALRDAGLRVLLQTCGLFAMGPFEARVHPHLDLIHFDLKLADEAAHVRWCGGSNRVIHANLRRLLALERAGGAGVLPRVPLIPGVTDTPENLEGLAGVLTEAGGRRVAVVPYNPLWSDKLPRIGARPRRALEGSWMSAAHLARCEGVFSARGLEVA